MEYLPSLRDLYQRASRDLGRTARNHWLNHAFLEGHQWLYVPDPENLASDIYELPSSDRITMVDNRMAANHRTIMANATKQRLEFSVRPNGADDASQQAAFVATEVCYWMAQEQKWERLREEASVAMLKGGTAGLSLQWDPAENTTRDQVLSIVEFVVEPGSRDPETARWWMSAQLLPPETVQAMFNMDEAPEGDAVAGINPLQHKLLSTYLGEGYRNKLTLLLSYWERPTPINPKGKVIIEVGRERVFEGDWPFPFDHRLNLSVGVETRVEGRWYGSSSYTHARSPQVGLNYVQSNLSEHLRDASSAKLLVPHSAINLLDSLNDVPGFMYPYGDGQAPPQWLQPPQLPAWLERLADNYRMSVDDAMGVHDVSRGRAPANLESGTAISILAEQDGSPVGRVIKEVARMFASHAQMSLMLHESEGANVEHSAVIEGDQGPMAVKWTGKDISGQYDVTVPEDSLIPRSNAAQLQMAIKLLEMGRLESLEDFIRFSEAPGMRNLVDVVDPAVAKARRNHASLAQGEPVIPAEFDDFEVLIREGNKFRMSELYERLDPEDQENVDLYIEACQTLAAEQAGDAVGRTEFAPGLGAVPRADGGPLAGPELVGPPPVEPSPVDLAQQIANEF